MAIESLGELTSVDPRKIWAHEAKDFTPWLAQNLALLGKAMGLDLELVQTEAAIGAFACDVRARDTGSGRVVLIENQLAQTDHSHLGQLLTYAAGLDAGVIVWIAPEIREEHREAIDFLNRHTRETLDFFLIALEVVRISDSLPAAVFKLAASPNAWAKTRAVSAQKAISDNGILYQKFFQGLVDNLREKYMFTNARVAQPQSWQSFATGKSGITYTATFASESKLRTELYIDVGDAAKNKHVFDALKAEKDGLEAAVGEPLAWDRLDHRRASRISIVRQQPTSIGEASVNQEPARQWLIEQLLKFKKVFGPRLPALVEAANVRQIGTAPPLEPGAGQASEA